MPLHWVNPRQGVRITTDATPELNPCRLVQRDPLETEWFPCDFPERRFDDGVAFHACCHACFVAAQAGKVRGETLIDPDNLCDPPRVCHGYKFNAGSGCPVR